MIIKWKPNVFLETNNGTTILFPATILVHEGAHVLLYLEYGKERYIKSQKTKVDKYKNKIEEEVITTTEQVAAKLHGDIRENETTREGHCGRIRFFDTREYGYAAAEYFRKETIEKLK